MNLFRFISVIFFISILFILFYVLGPIANKLDQDFSRLISTGKLASPSLYIPGYVPKKRRTVLGYRQCGYRDPNEKKGM